jgi:hypothetical protein
MPDFIAVLQSPTRSELRMRDLLLLCLSDIGELKAKSRQFHVFMQQQFTHGKMADLREQLNRSPSLTRKIVFSRISLSFWYFGPSHLEQSSVSV